MIEHHEYTVAMVKSLAVKSGHGLAILNTAPLAGVSILHFEYVELHPEQITGVYADHVSKPYWEILRNSVGQGVIVAILIGPGAVARWRRLMGPTLAPFTPGTIRHDYAHRINVADNAVHGSDSFESAKKELFLLLPHMWHNANIHGIERAYDDRMLREKSAARA